MILLYVIILISLLLVIFSLKCTLSSSNKENFDDFKVDDNELINEHSIRFFKDKPFNDQRGAFAFKNIDYFVKNKDNIFKYYNTDKRIIDFYEENHNKSFEPITDTPEADSTYKQEQLQKLLNTTSYGSNQVGMGFDNNTNSSKIYILDKTSIKSLKIINDKEITSIYNIIPNFEDKNMIDFYGNTNTEKIKKNLASIKMHKDDFINNLENNEDMLTTLFGKEKIDDYKNELLKYNKNKGTEPLTFEHLNCYNRIDNNKLIGYHFDFSDYNLKLGKDRNFIKSLLLDLEINIDSIDNWIDNNKNAELTWISFIKIGDKESVTIYYRN